MRLDYRLFLGILLIGGGLLGLLQAAGYARELMPEVWMAIFSVTCLVALAGYALSGFRRWGWLFPAGVAGGLAVVLALATMGVDQPWMAAPLFVGLCMPFAAAFLADRARNWWALIPGSIMLFLVLTVLLADGDRGVTIGPLALLAIAVPFYIIYFRVGGQWWAIIPAGILSLIAVIAILGIAGFINAGTEGGLISAFMMSGVAAVFAVIGWRDRKSWAKVVTLGFLGIAVASLLVASQSQVIGALAIMVLGVYVLVSSRRAQVKA